MRLEGKRIAILAEREYEDLELWYPLLRLREEGAQVLVVGSGSAQSYPGKHGYQVHVDASAGRVQAGQFDAVIIPGGWAPDRLRQHEAVLGLVREAYQQGKVVAAICHAASVLVSAGILAGKRVTCYRALKDDVANAGATYLDQEVVRDGNLITSRVPGDLPAFCREVIAALEGGSSLG